MNVKTQLNGWNKMYSIEDEMETLQNNSSIEY